MEQSEIELNFTQVRQVLAPACTMNCRLEPLLACTCYLLQLQHVKHVACLLLSAFRGAQLNKRKECSHS